MDDPKISTKRQIITALAVLIVIVVIVTGVTVSAKKNANGGMKTVSTTDSSSSSSNTTAPVASNASFKDGTYSATGSYNSPGGNESIQVSITLKSGVVTDTSAKSGANDAEAEQYQDQFISGYKQQVVGKKIGDIKLSRVSGSSLTSQGFNSALQKIESEAQA